MILTVADGIGAGGWPHDTRRGGASSGVQATLSWHDFGDVHYWSLPRYWQVRSHSWLSDFAPSVGMQCWTWDYVWRSLVRIWALALNFYWFLSAYTWSVHSFILLVLYTGQWPKAEVSILFVTAHHMVFS